MSRDGIVILYLCRRKSRKHQQHERNVPTNNTELRKAVETEFMPMLTKEAKFIIIDPESLLSPLKGNDDYKELMEYLETRYWK